MNSDKVDEQDIKGQITDVVNVSVNEIPIWYVSTTWADSQTEPEKKKD